MKVTYCVQSYDACTGDKACPHCAAGRPEAPDWLPDPADSDGSFEMDDVDRYALPPAYHRPRFMDTCTPKVWICAVCWDEGQVSGWPCVVAERHGAYVQRAFYTRERITSGGSMTGGLTPAQERRDLKAEAGENLNGSYRLLGDAADCLRGPEEPRYHFAWVVREAREQRGWTQDELAEAANVSRPTLQRWETAKTGTPDPENARRVFRALGLDPRLIPVTLGYVTAEEMGVPPAPPRVFASIVEEAIRILEDPDVPAARKDEWVRFLRFTAQDPA